MAQPLLAMSGKTREEARLKMIEAALKEQAPKTYKDLKLRGKLQSFLQNHEQAMMESYDQAATKAREKVLHPSNPNLNRAPQLDAELHRAWEETLATWLEFSDQDDDSTIVSLSEKEQNDSQYDTLDGEGSAKPFGK